MTEAEFFPSTLVLENELARLSLLRPQDFDLLHEVAYHPDLWKLGTQQLATPEDLRAYIATALREKEQQVAYPFLITDKRSGRAAGSSRYGNISFANKRLEIGWTWIHPGFQGTGLNKACKFLLLRVAFETLQFNRVEIKTDVLNQQSRRAILKIGATEEGIFRKHTITSTGRVRDSIYFSIVNDEWPRIRATIFEEF